jgi:hypothetical protein
LLLKPKLVIGHSDQLGANVQEPTNGKHRERDATILSDDEVVDRADALVVVIIDSRADDPTGTPAAMSPLWSS